MNMNREISSCEVCIEQGSDGTFLVGELWTERSSFLFRYSPQWLEHPKAFAIDPSLASQEGSACEGVFSRKSRLFGIFEDCSPDRWGRDLLVRRMLLEEKARILTPWEFLLGVQDETRQGSLRLRDHDGAWLSSENLSVPPLTELRQVQALARAWSNGEDVLREFSKEDRYWLGMLVAPGSSLGGARPKANFRQEDGSLWIAKFPAQDDSFDVGGWEYCLHTLAIEAGIDVSPARLLDLSPTSTGHRTFCVQRFDRDSNGHRLFYASAMTLLSSSPDQDASYLDMACFLDANASPAKKDAMLEQLFRRVVFNLLCANRDDHLRNHGFLRKENGWELAPAFDVNPNPFKKEHVLRLNESDERPILKNVLESHPWYNLSHVQAKLVVEQVQEAVSRWQIVAKNLDLKASEMKWMSAVFPENTASKRKPLRKMFP